MHELPQDLHLLAQHCRYSEANSAIATARGKGFMVKRLARAPVMTIRDRSVGVRGEVVAQMIVQLKQRIFLGISGALLVVELGLGDHVPGDFIGKSLDVTDLKVQGPAIVAQGKALVLLAAGRRGNEDRPAQMFILGKISNGPHRSTKRDITQPRISAVGGTGLLISEGNDNLRVPRKPCVEELREMNQPQNPYSQVKVQVVSH